MDTSLPYPRDPYVIRFTLPSVPRSSRQAAAQFMRPARQQVGRPDLRIAWSAFGRVNHSLIESRPCRIRQCVHSSRIRHVHRRRWRRVWRRTEVGLRVAASRQAPGAQSLRQLPHAPMKAFPSTTSAISALVGDTGAVVCHLSMRGMMRRLLGSRLRGDRANEQCRPDDDSLLHSRAVLLVGQRGMANGSTHYVVVISTTFIAGIGDDLWRHDLDRDAAVYERQTKEKRQTPDLLPT